MQIRKPSIENILSFIVILLGFLWGINIFNLASLMLLLIFSMVIAKAVLLKDNHLDIPKSFILLITYFISYFLFASIYSDDIFQVFITYFLLPLLSVFSGYTLIRLRQKGFWDQTEYFILFISIGLATYGILNIYQRYQEGYDTLTWIAAGRMSVDFWRGDEVWPTLQATYFIPIIGILFYMVFISKGFLKKILYLIGFMFALITAFDIGSRTLIVLSIAVLCAYLLVYLKSNIISAKKKTNVTIVLALLIIGLLMLFIFNVGSLRTNIMESNFILRLTGGTKYDDVEGLLSIHGRDIRYKAIFDQMFIHPFGNIDLGTIESGGLGSAHNTWLEIFRVAGIVPFVLFIFWTIHSIKVLIKLFFSEGLLDKEMALPLIIVIVITVQFMTESMFTINTHLMNFYFLLTGMLEAYYIRLRRKLL